MSGQDASDGLFGGLAGDVSRRHFLRQVSAAGFGVSTAAFLAACGGSSSSSSSGASATTTNASYTATPHKGGTLRIGALGNGTSETYNPALIATPIDALHGYSVFDPLIRVAPFYKTEPGLALSWEHNADATVWEIKLRQGVTWHDGKPFTADDVIYTLRNLGSPTNLGFPAVANVKLRDLKKLDTYTVQVPLSVPTARLWDYFIYFNSSLVIQDGAKNFSKPIGTGPYKLESFTPGQRSVLTANRDYWDSPRPYPDGLEIISIDDDTARLNALTSGQVDICTPLNFAQAKAGGGGRFQTLVTHGGSNNAFYMRVDQAPFNDVRVRQAMKLIVNRPALIESAFSGFGAVANDLFGQGLEFYDTSLAQHEQDIAQAKSLLKAAGQSDLRVTLHTSDIAAGVVEAATAFAQQATAAGVTIQLKNELPANYFNPTVLYLKMPFAQTIWPISSLDSFYSQALLSNAAENETHWASKSFDALFLRAQAATDPGEAQALWSQLQQLQWNEGGYITWVVAHNVDAISNNVAGIGGPGTGWLLYPDDNRVWNWGLKA